MVTFGLIVKIAGKVSFSGIIVVNLVGKFTGLKEGSEVIVHAVTWQIETVALSPTCLQRPSYDPYFGLSEGMSGMDS